MRLIEDPLHQPMPARLWVIPIVSTLAASALTLLPIVAATPAMPPCGLLLALAWRLRRPEMWPAWIALPLGLADDLIGGAALGSAALLWTIAFLLIDFADHRPMWRDHWLDWGLASVAILFCVIGAFGLALATGGGGTLWPPLPQALFGILCFPFAQRVCGRLDSWRLAR